ncbi:MAG TPA: ornithine carbamoyltransferase [Stellaceae bacterium]|nr:ornithine carbamoyltransferase [Stellaceae bacterium]
MDTVTDTVATAPPRHFLDLDRIDRATLRRLLDKGREFKRGTAKERLPGKILALIFEKPSTRTRLSFEVAIKQLGGDAICMTSSESQLSRGETMADTARVLSRYVQGVMMRTGDASNIEELAANASIPVVNGLTDRSHPCQIMADVMTLEERTGDLAGKIVAWCGDGNNVATSWIHAAQRFGFELRLACPKSLAPPNGALAWAKSEGARVSIVENPREAVKGAHCIVTDTWASMGVADAKARAELLLPYQVNARLMALARPDAIFMHCLPAKRDKEVTAEVIDGPQSAVWDEAENRLHVQKAILAWCMG